MSEFDTLKNMLERENVKFIIDVEKEYNDDTDSYDEVSYVCIPAVADEYLILGFTPDGDLCYVNAETDWEGFLKRRGE